MSNKCLQNASIIIILIFIFVLISIQVSDVVTQTMIGAIIIGVLLLLIIQFLFIHQMPYIFRHTPSKYLARTLMLCGIYTIIGSAAFVALIAYRAYVFCDSVCHFAFLLCAYQYFTLLIDYVDGESNFIKNSSGVMVFNIQTPPLCCCLRFLQPTEITKYVINQCIEFYLTLPYFGFITCFCLFVFFGLYSISTYCNLCSFQ